MWIYILVWIKLQETTYQISSSFGFHWQSRATIFDKGKILYPFYRGCLIASHNLKLMHLSLVSEISILVIFFYRRHPVCLPAGTTERCLPGKHFFPWWCSACSKNLQVGFGEAPVSLFIICEVITIQDCLLILTNSGKQTLLEHGCYSIVTAFDITCWSSLLHEFPSLTTT